MSFEPDRWYDELRDRYRPTSVRLLLIGESPPDPRSAERRFFYAPMLAYDNLYRSVVLALYGTDPGFDVSAKADNLARLRDDGVWLVDAVDEPVNAMSKPERVRRIRASVPSLLAKCRDARPSVGIIVCHSVVYSAVAPSLRSEGLPLLHDEPLPFPLGNKRAEFVAGVRRSLGLSRWHA